MSVLQMLKKLSLLGVFWSLTLTDAVKVKRVKAGGFYKEHDPVHIVVNKVG
jgi:hypothetical protein